MMAVSTLKSTFDIVVPSRGQVRGPYSSACWNVSPSTVGNSRSPGVGSTAAFRWPCSKNNPRQTGQASTEVELNDFVCRVLPSRGQFIASSSRRPLHRQLQHHRRPHTLDRGDGDLAAVRLHDLLDDIEA